MPSQTDTSFPRPVQSIHVAPHVEVIPVDLRRIPALGVFEWRRRPDGSYQPQCRVHECWLRVSEAEKLPLGLSAEVIVRLIRGGFVEGGRPAPNSTTVNVVSLLEHYEATREDPHFWTAERIDLYRHGLAKLPEDYDPAAES